MKEGDELTKEGEPASAAAAEVNNAEVARVNDDKERKRKQMDSKAFAAVKSFEDRLHEKLLTGAPNTNTNINADMASDDALCSSGLKEEAPEKDEHVHEVVEGEDDLSDQPKGTTPASGDVISSSSAAVIRNDEGEMMKTAYPFNQGLCLFLSLTLAVECTLEVESTLDIITRLMKIQMQMMILMSTLKIKLKLLKH